MRLRVMLLSLLPAALSWRAASADCIVVPGESVMASDVARRLAAFAGLAPETVLMPAPAAGLRRILTPAELARLMTRFGIASSPVAEPGASLCLERQARTLSQEEILSALGQALPPDTEIDLVEFSRYAVPQGAIHFDRKGIATASASAPASQPVLWRGAIKSESGRTTVIWARLRLFHKAEVMVATKDLAPGVTIEAQDVVLERQRVAGISDSAPAAAQLAGRTPRRLIHKGERVTLPLTAPAPEIYSGQQVQVEVREGAVRLALPARAETSGRTGSRIWLRASANGKRFLARVTGPGQVEVERSQP